MDFSKRCLANVYIRKAFVFIYNSDFYNAQKLFRDAQKYDPVFKQLNAYIAYSNSKLGNLTEAAKYYTKLINTDSTSISYIETTSYIYKLMGDTTRALEIVKRGRKLLPADISLILDEANIYNNRKDYRSLAPLLPALLDNNTNNPDIAFIAANCYDHLNRYDKAESLYLQAVELNNSSFDPIFNLGLLYLKQAELKGEKAASPNTYRALQWLEKANEISPNDTRCLQMLQLAYIKTGNTTQINRINNKLKQLTNQ
jgi:tetratricopeptide (TPR) repeat protein